MAIIRTFSFVVPPERAEEMQLENVLFSKERPLTELPAMLAGSDVCVSSVAPDAYLEKIISVKVFEYLACERPTIAAQKGETAMILKESGGGLSVPPGDGVALADAISSLYSDPDLRAAMSRHGKQYVEHNYSRQRIAERFESIVVDAAMVTRPARAA